MIVRFCAFRDEHQRVIRTFGVNQDITDRKKAEETLRRDEARNRALFELAQMSGLTPQDIAERAMDHSIELSGSQIGYIAFLNEDETVLTMQHYSKGAMERCAIVDKPMVFETASTGLWAEAVRQRKVVVTNDYDASNPLKKGLPCGHVPLRRHMCIPVFDRGRIVAVAGVGNKDSDYTEQDATDIALLMEGMWHIVRKIQAEAALRMSEKEFSQLIDTIPDFVVRTDIEGTITLVNNRALEISGFSREEVIGKSVFAFMAPEDVDRAVANMRAMPRGKMGPVRYDLVMKDGTRVPFETNGDLIRGADGSPLGTVLVGRDIIERNRMESRLEHLNRELLAIKGCNKSMFRASAEQELLDNVCRIVCEVAGYRLAWIGMAERDEARTVRPVAWYGFNEDYVANIRATWGEDERGCGPAGTAIKTGQTVFIQDWAVDARAGPWRALAQTNGYGSSIAMPLMDSGVPFGALMIYSEQTNGFTGDEVALLEEMVGDLAYGVISLRAKEQRDVALEALKKSEASRLALFEAVPDTAWVIDQRSGRFIDANPAATLMYGYSKEEFTNLTICDISAEPEKSRRAIDPVQTFIPLRYHRRKDGTVLPVEIVANLCTIDGRPTIVGTARDITDRIRSGEALGEANRKLNLLSSITRHDLNNQMTMLRGYLQLIDEKAPGLDRIEKCRTITDRVHKIIQFTETYEDIGVKEPLWFDLRELIGKAQEEVIAGRISVINAVPSGILVLADPLVIKVMSNLIDNAIRHGGDAKNIRFSVVHADEALILVCQDDGAGIPAGDKQHIFDKGFGKNTGLGLFLSREVLGITGIMIRECGVPGEGARFELQVPPGTYKGKI